MRIEIVKPDSNKIIKQLWKALYPLNKIKGFLVFMTFDAGKNGNERAMIINIANLNENDVNISKT